jgi:hypothetical protein
LGVAVCYLPIASAPKAPGNPIEEIAPSELTCARS